MFGAQTHHTDCSFRLGNLFAAPDQDTEDHDKENPGKYANYGNAVHCVSFLLDNPFAAGLRDKQPQLPNCPRHHGCQGHD